MDACLEKLFSRHLRFCFRISDMELLMDIATSITAPILEIRRTGEEQSAYLDPVGIP